MTTKTDITQERVAFEARFSKPPFEWEAHRYGEDSAWPGNYQNYDMQCAWEAWQARAAVEADRQGRMPSDEEIIAEFANAQTSDGSSQPDPYRENLANQAEAINMERLSRWLTAYGISTPESMESFAASFGEQVNALTLREPFPTRQPAASVEPPEPVAYLIRGEQQHDQFRMDLAQAKACKRLRDKDFDGEDQTAIVPLYAAPVASQAQPCNHAFEARPIDGSNSAAVPCEPVCLKCGYRPAARAAREQR